MVEGKDVHQDFRESAPPCSVLVSARFDNFSIHYLTVENTVTCRESRNQNEWCQACLPS